MSEKKKLQEVFKTVGLPPYTYVKPPYYGEVRADIVQPGKHLLIEGPSGIGKTCVAFKVFEELQFEQNKDFLYVSCRDVGAMNTIDSFLAKASDGIPTPTAILVIDDFHLLPAARRAEIGSLLKRLSDRAFEFKTPPKAVLIGIPTTGVSLLSDAYDLGPRLGTYVLKRVSDVEIDKLLYKDFPSSQACPNRIAFLKPRLNLELHALRIGIETENRLNI
jgi:Cdc6-like AAA superfamily ATPase